MRPLLHNIVITLCVVATRAQLVTEHAISVTVTAQGSASTTVHITGTSPTNFTAGSFVRKTTLSSQTSTLSTVSSNASFIVATTILPDGQTMVSSGSVVMIGTSTATLPSVISPTAITTIGHTFTLGNSVTSMTTTTVPGITSTASIVPTDFSIQTVTNAEWTTNTWITTTGSDSFSTVVPVLVGCPGCGGDQGSGIILWHLPPIPGVSFQLPQFPSLPKFSLPCIKILSAQVEDCRPQSDNPGKGGDGGKNPTTNGPSKTNPITGSEPTKSQQSTSNPSSSSSTCAATSIVSDCTVACSETAVSSSTSVTCFTTACSRTVTGCSVTGTTTTTTTSASCRAKGTTEVSQRTDNNGGSCPLSCPDWSITPDPELDSYPDEADSSRKRVIAGRLLVPRGGWKLVTILGKCAISAVMPAEMPVMTPAYPGGRQFLEADKINFQGAPDKAAKAASAAVPRWYSKTVDSVACTLVAVKLDHTSYLDTNGEQIPSFDHVWEKSWVNEFFTSTIDDAAAALDSVNGVGNGKLTCSDLKQYMFAPTKGVGTQNLLTNVWNSIASNDNMEFMGMTQELNGYKNLVWDTKVNLPNGLKRLKKLKVSGRTVIDRALGHMEEKLGYLERIRLGVYMTNLPDNQRLIDITNNRVHAAMKKLDTDLRTQNPEIKPFNEQGGWFFTRLFETYQNDLLDDVSTGVKPCVAASARDMILHIREIWPDLDKRQSELNDEPLKKKWKSIETRWNYYKALPSSTWLIDITWSWGCGTVTRRANGDACPLIPPLSTANATSVEATTTTPPTSQPTAVPTGPPTTTTGPPSNTITTSPVPTCHMDADCQRSAYAGLCKYMEAIKCQDGKCMCRTNPPPVSNTTTGTSPPITTTQSVGPSYCTYYADPHQNIRQCICTDDKTYSVATSTTGAVCPTASPANGWTEVVLTTTLANPPTPVTTTQPNGAVVVCTSFSKIQGIPSASACVGPTISMPYATGTCTAYMAEFASIDGYMADVVLYDDNEMEIGRSPNLPNTWRPAAWGSNITIKDSKLMNTMSIEFLEGVLDKRSITTPANSRQREVPSDGRAIKRQIPAFGFWDIVFTLGDQNWSTKDSDDQKLPFCDVRDWTYASDNVLVSIPFPIPDDPWLSVRLLGCRWKC